MWPDSVYEGCGFHWMQGQVKKMKVLGIRGALLMQLIELVSLCSVLAGSKNRSMKPLWPVCSLTKRVISVPVVSRPGNLNVCSSDTAPVTVMEPRTPAVSRTCVSCCESFPGGIDCPIISSAVRFFKKALASSSDSSESSLTGSISTIGPGKVSASNPVEDTRVGDPEGEVSASGESTDGDDVGVDAVPATRAGGGVGVDAVPATRVGVRVDAVPATRVGVGVDAVPATRVGVGVGIQ